MTTARIKASSNAAGKISAAALSGTLKSSMSLAGAGINSAPTTNDSQMGSDHPNYLFPLSLYAAYTCCFPLKSCFEARKAQSKRIIASLHEIFYLHYQEVL